MAITITIDNDTSTTNTLEDLILDESGGLQTSGTTDKGNDSNLDITDATVAVGNTPDSNLFDGTLSGAGFSASFLSFLNASTIFTYSAFQLTDAQLAYAAGVEGAVSATDFVKVTVTNNETVSDLFFSDSSGAALNGDQVVGMQTLDGSSVYLWSNGDYCIATTSSTAGAGRIVAAFYLNESVDHLTAQVQMVTFEPLKHPDGTSADDALNFTNVMNVSAAGSQSFDFDALKSGGCLWAAVGTNAGAVVVSGYNLDIDGEGKLQAASDKIAVSQGGDGTTIGLNNQLFDAVNETAVFTLVTGLDVLGSSDGGFQSDYIVDHTGPKADGLNYTGYINVTGAGIYISQSEGNTAKDFAINLYSAGGGTSPEVGFDYIGTEPHGAFDDDTPVNVGTVTIIADDGHIVGTWGTGGLASGTTVDYTSPAEGLAHVTVTINGNNIDIGGVLDGYTVKWTSTGDTFNRFTLVDEGAGKFDVGRVDLTQGLSVHQAIGGDLVAQDDGPAPSGLNYVGHVDEDAMTGSGGGDLSTGIVDSSDDGDGIAGEQDEVTFTQADLGVTVNVGTDSPAIFSLVSSIAAGTAVKTTSGANVFSKGDQLFWRVSSGVLQGVVNAGTGTERVIFTITVNDQGTVTKTDDTFTFDLKDQLDHGNAAGELANLLLNITPAFTATDADGDPVNFGTNTPIRMQVENDTPTFTAQISDGTVEFANDSTGVATGNLHGAIGADDTNATNSSQTPSVKQYTFVPNSWTEPHTVYADLDGVLSADGTKITFYSTSVTADQNSSTAVYEITLNQTANSGAGSYTFTVLQPPPENQTNFDFTDLPSGQNLLGVIASDKTDLTKGGLLVIPTNPDLNADGTFTNASGTINTSKGGGPVTIGNGNQAFDHNYEGAFFCYVDNPASSSVGGLGLTQTLADDADTVQFDGTIEVTNASVEIVQASGKGTVPRPGPSLQITAYDINPQTVGHLGDVGVETDSDAFVLDPTATDTQVSIIGVKIHDATGAVIEYRTNLLQGASNGGAINDTDDAGTGVSGIGGSDDPLVGIQFILDAGGGTPGDLTDDIYSVVVSQLKANYTIEFITADPHDLAKVQNLSGSYDIGGFNVFSNTNVPAQDFDFQVQINDYDNDSYTSALAQFSVHINAVTF